MFNQAPAIVSILRSLKAISETIRIFALRSAVVWKYLGLKPVL